MRVTYRLPAIMLLFTVVLNSLFDIHMIYNYCRINSQLGLFRFDFIFAINDVDTPKS